MQLSIASSTAVYSFNIVGEIAYVTQYIRKGCKGYDKSTTCSRAMARKWWHSLLKQQNNNQQLRVSGLLNN